MHRHASFVGLFKGTLNRGGYRQLLQRLHGFYLPLEAAVDRVMNHRPDPVTGYHYVPRSHLLADDLIRLGIEPGELRTTPRCGRIETIVSSRSLGGVIYVMEGSTQGGSVIDKAARRLLQNDGPDGRRYWSWCRTEHARRWAVTNRYLQHLPHDDATLTDLVAGAQDTFDAMAAWLAPLDCTPTPSETG